MPATAPQSHGRPGQAVVVHGGRHRRPDGHAGEAHSIKRAIPDILSTCRLPQILSRVEGFSRSLARKSNRLGLSLLSVRPTPLFTATRRGNCAPRRNPPVFKTVIRPGLGPPPPDAPAGGFSLRNVNAERWRNPAGCLSLLSRGKTERSK